MAYQDGRGNQGDHWLETQAAADGSGEQASLNCQDLAEALRALAVAHGVQILLLDPEGGCLVPTVFAGDATAPRLGRVSCDQGMVAETMRVGEARFVPETAAEPDLSLTPAPPAGEKHSLLLVPIPGEGLVAVLDPCLPVGGGLEDALASMESGISTLVRWARTTARIASERAYLQALLDSGPTPTVTFAGERAVTAVVSRTNRAFQRLMGREIAPGTRLVDVPAFMQLYRPDRSTLLSWDEMPVARAIDGGETLQREELHLQTPEGGWVVVLANAAPTRWGGRITGAVISLQDITELKNAEDALRTEARRREALMELGRRGLAGDDPGLLAEEAARLVAEVLPVDFTLVTDLLPDGTLTLRAGVGCPAEMVGARIAGAEETAQRLQLLRSAGSVILNDLYAQTRFTIPECLRDEGVSSAVLAGIQGRERLIGTVAAYAKKRGAFSQDDIRFVEAVAGMLAVAIDRKRSDEALEQRVEQLLDLTELAYAVGSASDLDTIYPMALEALRDGLGVERASILLRDPDDVVRYKAWAGLSEDYRRRTEGHLPWLLNDPNPQPVLVDNVEEDAALATLRDTIVGEGIGSLAFIPLMHQGRLVGKFVVYHDTPHHFTEDEVRVAQAIASHIALAIGRKLYEDALRRSEVATRRVLDSLDSPIAVLDEAGTITRVNEAWVRFAEANGADAETRKGIGLNYLEVCRRTTGASAEGAAEVLTGLQALLDGELESLDVEYPCHSPTQQRWFLMRAVPLRHDGGGAIVSHINITERMRAEKALRESEERFRSLVETTSDWIWEVDAEGHYTYASPRIKDLLGYEPAEVLGKTPFDLTAPEDAERIRSLFHESSENRAPFVGIVNHNLHRDGHEVILETSGVPIISAEGELRGYRGIDRDITERKRAEEALRLLADVGQVLTSSLDPLQMLEGLAWLVVPRLGDWCIIYLLTDEGTVQRGAIAYADPADAEKARRLMEYPPPSLERVRPQVEALRTGKTQVFPTVPDAILQSLATSPEHLELIYDLAAKSAITVPFAARGRMLGIAHFFFTVIGHALHPGDVALAEEIGRRAAVAIDNARLFREVQEANAAKDQFLAVLSHELRNPLAPILAGVDVLRRVISEDPRVQRTLEIIERNAKLQARLVNDLLDLSRVARGKIQMQRTPVDLEAVVQTAIQAQRPDAEQDGLQLLASAKPGLFVLGDFDRLQQVVVNLISNAIKFTSAPGEVRVSLEEVDGQARVTVADTGVGIAPDQLPKLFDMFQQGGTPGQRKPGLGIGLALVKSITEMLGGRVWAESEGLGHGSRFIVELPLIAQPEPARESEAAPAAIRLLLVEDNPDTRSVLEDSLTMMGYSVEAAGTAEEGLATLRQGPPPDAILSDIRLPGMDGYEFMRAARKLEGLSEVPAFAITGFGQAEDVRQAREAGYTAHFVKPIDVAAIAEQVHHAVVKRREQEH